jgi:hypothetical protein
MRTPWSFSIMNTYAKLAVAAVVVIAVGAIGLALFGLGRPTEPGPTAVPSSAPAQRADPSAPPPLTGRFTSDVHGITMDYPAGWTAVPATEPWTTQAQSFESPASDIIHDPELDDHLFLDLASRQLDGQTGSAWADDVMALPEEGCEIAPEPVTVAGADGGVLCPTGIVAAWAGDRAYLIRLYTSDDESWLHRFYDSEWFKGVIATVQLHPEDAVGTAP